MKSVLVLAKTQPARFAVSRTERGSAGRQGHASGACATPENPARDRHRGVAEGVAHAPDASVTVADSRADCDPGGTERRPPTPHRTPRLGRTSPNLSRPAVEWTSPRTPRSTARVKGEHCSRVCVPPLFSYFRSELEQPRVSLRRRQRPRSLRPDLLTGLVESCGGQPLIWSEPVL